MCTAVGLSPVYFFILVSTRTACGMTRLVAILAATDLLMFFYCHIIL